MSWRGELSPTCWEPSEATKILHSEAEAPSDAVFIATHGSIPIFLRNTVDNSQRTTRTNDANLLSTVQQLPADLPILPILGSPGTGKSHLVRWLRAKLPADPSTRVIFVPKHQTSLRGIVERILEHASGDLAEELGQKLKTASDGLTGPGEAKLRLRNALAVLVETHGTQADCSSEERELRAYLASDRGLPALLGDSVFRHRLFEENSPISRLVSEKLDGRGTMDKEEAFGFTPEDLALSVDDTTRAGADAEEVAGALSSDVGLRELAARMLNDQLGPAVGETFGIGGNDLKELLVEVRLQLKRQGLSLLLMVEDFAIFQGVQGGLVDAITLFPTQELDLCPMRVVMAVNTGYFLNEMPNSLKDRVYRVFDLDDPNPQVTFDTEALAAKYMNAIRVGSRTLNEAHGQGEEIPNACEQCPVNDACLSGFGAIGGVGLFPFNRDALTKAVSSKAVGNRLSVRSFLTSVLRPVLFNQHSHIDQGDFPTPEFDTAFRFGAIDTLASVEDEVRLKTPGDPDLSKRRVVLVRYWGPEGTEPRNLQPVIHEAFSVPMIEGLPGPDDDYETPEKSPLTQSRDAETAITPTPNEQNPPAPHAPKQSRQIPRLVQAIDDWRATNQLRQGPRNDLRNFVHAAVIARLTLDDGLGGSPMWTKTGKEWDGTFEAQTAITFSDQGLAEALITIDKDDEEDIRVLRALAWVNSTEDWGKVDNGEVLQRVVEERICAWAASVSAVLFPQREKRDDPELVVATHTLLATSKALGIPDAFKDDALSRTRALFAPAPLAQDGRRPKLRLWQQRISDDQPRLTRTQLQLRVLRLASFTQGTGDPLALDLPRLTRALRGKEIGKVLPPAVGLLGVTAKAVQDRQNALPDVRDEARLMVPDLSELGGNLPEVIKELEKLVTERATAGRLPSAIDAAELISAGKAIKPGDHNRVENVRAKIDNWDHLSVDDQVRLLTDDWDAVAARVRQWLSLAMQAVQALEARLGGDANSAAELEYDRTRTALVDTLQNVTILLDLTPESEATT